MTPNPSPRGGSVIQGSFRGGRPPVLQLAMPATAATSVQAKAPLPFAATGGVPKPVVQAKVVIVPPPIQFPGRPPIQAKPAVVAPALGLARLTVPLPKPVVPPKGAPLPSLQPKGMQLSGGGEAFEIPATLNLASPGGGQRLPESVQQKMEAFFGTSFTDVRVHVGAQASSIGALAFTHGSNLYFAPGQYNPHTSQGQQLLGHELTHVVQQRAGRVRNPFGSGVAVVQDGSLEAEADRLGLMAASYQLRKPPSSHPVQSSGTRSIAVQQKSSDTIQLGKTKSRKRARARAAHLALIERERQEEEKREFRRLSRRLSKLGILAKDKLNVVGEDHEESDERREAERQITTRVTGGGYWNEDEFQVNVGGARVPADPYTLQFLAFLQMIFNLSKTLAETINPLNGSGGNTLANMASRNISPSIASAERLWALAQSMPHSSLITKLSTGDQSIIQSETMANRYKQLQRLKSALGKLCSRPANTAFRMSQTKDSSSQVGVELREFGSARKEMVQDLHSFHDLTRLRSEVMHEAAQLRSGTKGVWKIGERHVQDILNNARFNHRNYNLVTQADFNEALSQANSEVI